MSMERVVIIGRGRAGRETARRLRDNGFDGTITAVSDEPAEAPPCARLSDENPGRASDSSGARRPVDEDIELVLGKPVVRIARGNRHIELVDGSIHSYDHLIVATGARARSLLVPGATLEGVHHMCAGEDAESLLHTIRLCRSLVVVGAGLAGLEIAAAACSRGMAVTVLEIADKPMSQALSVPMSNYISAVHAQHGVSIRLSTRVERILGSNGRVAGLLTTQGDTIGADAVVVAIGVAPNAELAARSDLPVSDGIVVDGHLRTPDDRITAIGDCTALPARGRSILTSEGSVRNSVYQARYVAGCLTGEAQAYHSVPWFRSTQHQVTLEVAGIASGAAASVFRGSVDAGGFSIFSFTYSKLVGVESVNRPDIHEIARILLTHAIPVTPTHVADPTFDFERVVARYREVPLGYEQKVVDQRLPSSR